MPDDSSPQPVARPLVPAVEVRTCTAADWPSILWVDQTAFSYTFEGEPGNEPNTRVFEPERSLLAWSGDEPVGHTNAHTLVMSVPGGALVPTAGVTWVGVTPTMRRRGVLTALMSAQLQQVYDKGEPLAALYASEPGIYGRFGYGVATTSVSMRVAHGLGAVRPEPDPSLHARIVTVADGRPAVERVYALRQQVQAGIASRDDLWWGRSVNDPPAHRGGYSELRTLVVGDDDGARAYAMFAATQDWVDGSPEGRLRIRETLSLDPAADALLWQTVFDIDLVVEVHIPDLPPDAPLMSRLVELRKAKPTLRDGLYVRLVDLPAALAARTYDVAWSGVVEVEDRYAPWNAGRWSLQLGPDDAGVARTDAEPDLVLDVAELGAAYLGGTSLAQRGLAGLVTERTPGALDGLSRALRHEPGPYFPFHF